MEGMRWAGLVASMDEMKHVYKILLGKSERKLPPGKRRSRHDDNIERM
jgi:hypothetical protein